jgi:hypothetical protein
MERPWDAIWWWETRRVVFNLILFVVGLLSILIGNYAMLASPPILLGIIAYAIAANIFYTLGWISEILWSAGDTTRTEALRPNVFRLGLLFSVCLTLLPGSVVLLARLVLAVNGQADVP